MIQSIILLSVILAYTGLSIAICTDDQFIELATNITTASANEIEVTRDLYQKARKEINVLQQVKNTLGSQLRTLHARPLANELCFALDSRTMIKIFQSQAQTLNESYEPELVEDILGEAMSELHSCKTMGQLMDALNILSNEGDINTFERMLKSQLQLYHSYAENTTTNSNSFANLVYKLFKIRQMNLYQSVCGRLRQQVDNLLRNLPENIKHLLFQPYFCLMNEKYSEYLYTTSYYDVDTTSSYIWAWHEKRSIDKTGHIKASVTESGTGDPAQLAVQLQDNLSGKYFYMMSGTNLIAAWKLSSQPLNSIWNIEFVDNDRVALYQGDYIMCSTDEKSDTTRRLVRGYERGTYTETSTECQWLLGKCYRT